MTTQSLILNIPDSLFERLKQRADQTQRTIEDELLEVVTTALPAPATKAEIAPELATELAALLFLNDKALWKAARTHLPPKSIMKLETLHNKQRAKSLTETETNQKDELHRQYNRALLVRAEAAFLLKQRGYDVSVLLKTR